MESGAIILLVVFGVMGFGVNLFFRAIFIYQDWQEGQPINWWWQLLIAFGVPAVCVLAIAEVMLVLGLFS
jgi:hypothetical protein